MGRTAAAKFLLGLVLLLACGWSASAYTLVKRDGQRIVIPNEFTVTTLTLTYEAAPGVNVTIALTNLDIAATERANNAPAGSLLHRAQLAAPPAATDTPARTVTNADLATYRRNREAQEAAINRQRAAQGLPSLEQEAQQAQADAARYLAQTAPQRAARRAAETANEALWRERATRWRAEAAALDAQINYATARLAETVNNAPSSLYAPRVDYQPGALYAANQFYGIGSGVAYGTAGPTALQLSQVRPGLAYNWGPGFNNLIPGTQVAPTVDLAANARAFRRAVAPVRGRRAGYQSGYFVVTQVAPAQNETATADYWRTWLAELRLARVALNTRWAALTDEARRADVPTEWLRP